MATSKRDGRRVSLSDVEVQSAQGNQFWVRDGDNKFAVIAPDGSPAFRDGEHVDMSGRVEADAGSFRIRADRIQQK